MARILPGVQQTLREDNMTLPEGAPSLEEILTTPTATIATY